MAPTDRLLPSAARSVADEGAGYFEGFTDTEALHYFLVAARCGCFTQAARSLSVKPTLLRKKLGQLALDYGDTLFVQQGRLMSLTLAGQSLRRLLQNKEAAGTLELLSMAQPVVRLAVAGSLLQDIVIRDLLGFLRVQANVRLELQCLDFAPDQAEQAPDLLLWLAEPAAEAPQLPFTVSELVCLTTLEYVPHVAKRYYRKANPPQSLVELEDYLLVSYQPYLQVPAFKPWNDAVSQRSAGTIEVNSYDLMRQMIQWSACIGLLPRYVSTLDRNLQPLPDLLPEPMRMQVWLAVQGGEARGEVVKHLLELIREAFSSRRGWFGEAAAVSATRLDPPTPLMS